MERIEKWLNNNPGDGSGYGSGDGSGYGSGYGSGIGSFDGNVVFKIDGVQTIITHIK